MHEIILYPRTVLYPSFIFYLSKNKKIAIEKFFYTLYKFLKLENLTMIFTFHNYPQSYDNVINN